MSTTSEKALERLLRALYDPAGLRTTVEGRYRPLGEGTTERREPQRKTEPERKGGDSDGSAR